MTNKIVKRSWRSTLKKKFGIIFIICHKSQTNNIWHMLFVCLWFCLVLGIVWQNFPLDVTEWIKNSFPSRLPGSGAIPGFAGFNVCVLCQTWFWKSTFQSWRLTPNLCWKLSIGFNLQSNAANPLSCLWKMCGFECLVLPIFCFCICVCVFASAFVFPAVGPHFHDWDICHFASATGDNHQDLHHWWKRNMMLDETEQRLTILGSLIRMRATDADNLWYSPASKPSTRPRRMA